MRREMDSYSVSYPQSSFHLFTGKLFERICVYFFKLKIKKIALGSPKWHKIQEKLSQKSSIGKDLRIRSMFYELTLQNCGCKPIIHPQVIFSFPQNIELSDNVFINRGTFITAPAKVSIGNNVLIGPYCVINSGNHIYESRNTLIRNQGHTELPIIIEDDVWIGSHVCILPGVTIGKGAVIGANSVVNSNVLPYQMAAGSPAVFKKMRL